MIKHTKVKYIYSNIYSTTDLIRGKIFCKNDDSSRLFFLKSFILGILYTYTPFTISNVLSPSFLYEITVTLYPSFVNVYASFLTLKSYGKWFSTNIKTF